MKTVTCNVHTMDGPSTSVDLANRFLMPLPKDLKLVLLGLQGPVRQVFLQWFLRVCSLFGRMRMVGKELLQLSLQCTYHLSISF